MIHSLTVISLPQLSQDPRGRWRGEKRGAVSHDDPGVCGPTPGIGFTACRVFGPGGPLPPLARKGPRVHRHRPLWAFLRLGCVAPVCIAAALATSGEVPPSLGRKALNLTMDNTARSGAPRADGIGYPSPWATRCVRPPSHSRLRLLPRPHPNPFPLAVAQARPSPRCPLIQAGSPEQRLPKVRCQSAPPARRRAGALSGARHRVPDAPGCRREDYRLPLSSFAQTSSASLSLRGGT